MAGAALTEVVLGLWRPNLFLVLVAIFSFYFAFRGRRVLGHKRPERGEGPTALDWTAAVGAAGASGTLLVLGLVQPAPVWGAWAGLPSCSACSAWCWPEWTSAGLGGRRPIGPPGGSPT